MRDRRRRTREWSRRVALVCVSVLGLVAVVGSGGGDAPECSFFSDTCNPVIVSPPPTPAASVHPLRAAVQAGGSIVFSAQASGVAQPAYQWRRSSDGGLSYAAVVGATGDTFTLTNAQLADDGNRFAVDVRDGAGGVVVATSNAATLLVSSLPGVGFSDGEFQPADWAVGAIADPLQNGPTHSEERVDTGGVPGSFRKMVHQMTSGPSSLRVFNLKPSAGYDPQVLGAIHAIDYSEDCNRLGASAGSPNVLSYLLLEQGGRRFVSNAGRGCLSQWVRPAPGPSLAAADFSLVDGPACATGQACPDFTAGAASLGFGFERRVTSAAGAAAESVEHGIDNWRVTVWRP